MISVCLSKFSRAVAVLLLLALTLPLISLQVSADETTEPTALPYIKVESKTVHRGQTFSVQVNLEKNPGLTAMILELEYDKSVMELVGVERGNALRTHTFTTTNVNTDEGYLVEPFRLLWDGVSQDSTTGVLLTLTFESKITAPVGDYPVKLTYEAQNTGSEYGKPIAVDIENGIVTLIKGEYSVIFQNYGGTVLYEVDYDPEDMDDVRDLDDLYVGKVPTRPEDECYSYAFKGWKGIVTDDPKTVIRVADYVATPQEYQVVFYVDGEYFHGDIYGYNQSIDLSYIPIEKNKNFSGWFLDPEYTQRVTFARMPAEDLKLYGYMRFNIRQDELPQITLSVDKIENSVAFVDVDVTKNPSLAGLVLTLDYDRTALKLIGFEQGSAFRSMQFSSTNTAEGYDADPFKFYWESAVNNTELGTILTLKFQINESVEAGLYGVTLTYDETTDATFFTDGQELWYTELDILGTSVPIGKIYHWYEETADGIGIDVTVEEGQSPDTVLEIKRITHLLTLDDSVLLTAAGEGMEVKDIYSVRLMRNGTEVKPSGKITVKIELTEAQLACRYIKIFRIEQDEKLTYYDSAREKEFIKFETETLSNWAVVGNVIIEGESTEPFNLSLVLGGLNLLAIVTIAFVLLVLVKVRRGKSIFNYD